MVNYEVDPAVLRPLVPTGVELDTFEGRSFVSMVGFLFLQTRVFGFRFPFHTNFEEVNLRFYVRRQTGGTEGWRRGTVFIKGDGAAPDHRHHGQAALQRTVHHPGDAAHGGDHGVRGTTGEAAGAGNPCP